MKKILPIILLVALLGSYPVFGQLKNQDKPIQIKQELMRPIQDRFLGLSIFDPSKFSMQHSFSMSYFPWEAEVFLKVFI